MIEAVVQTWGLLLGALCGSASLLSRDRNCPSDCVPAGAPWDMWPFWTGLGRIGMWVAAFGAMGRDEAAGQTPVRLMIFIFAAEYHLLGRLLQ